MDMTMNEDQFPQFRKMDISDPVTVTLPAHVWVSFWSAYTANPEWNDGAANAIAIAAQEAVVEPAYIQKIKEEHEKIHSRGNSWLSELQNQMPQPQEKPEEDPDTEINKGYL
jgi:hypothetical protein